MALHPRGFSLPTRLQDLGTSNVRLWVGDPDCDGAHGFLLEALQAVNCTFTHPGTQLTMQQFGNLGEFVAMVVGYATAFTDYACQPANAHEPLNTISKAGVDLVWYRFAADAAHDSVLLQEVKTTSDPRMTIRSGLIEDHRKMFGRSSRETLSTMLQSIKSHLVFSERRKDLADRITRMCGSTPSTCPGVRLHPTILHERAASDPEPVMLAVRTSIAGLGWPSAAIEPWSISLNELKARMDRLGQGNP